MITSKEPLESASIHADSTAQERESRPESDFEAVPEAEPQPSAPRAPAPACGPLLPLAIAEVASTTGTPTAAVSAAIREHAARHQVATVPVPVGNKPKQRGYELSNQKGLAKLTGFWLRKMHREWKDEPPAPGRIQAIAIMLRTGSQILETMSSVKELKEAEELFNLMKDIRKGGLGRA